MSLTLHRVRRQQEPPPNVTVLQRGIAAAKKGDLDAAARDLETVARIEPKNLDALSWYSYVLLRQSQPEKAIPYLERLLTYRPNDSDTCTNLGNALLMKPGRTTAETRRALDLFAKAAQLAPQSPEAQYNLGYALARTGQYERAIGAYKKSLSLKPRDGLAWTNMGYAYLQLNRNREAAEALRNGVSYAPQDVNTWIVLGMTELANGDANASVAALENAQKLDEKNVGVLTSLGRAYASARRYPDAIRIYNSAVEIAEAGEKKDPTPRYNLGAVYTQWGKLNDALTAYDQVLTIDPQHYDALVNSGYILYRQKKTEEAVARFKEAIKINNKNPLAWTNLAAACEAQQNWTGAIFAWRRALALDPTKYEYRGYMAEDFVELKRYGDAINVYKEMTTLHPQASDAYIELGRVYELRGSQETEDANIRKWLALALNAYEEAMKREPNSVEAQGDVKRLRTALSPQTPTTAAPAEAPPAKLPTPSKKTPAPVVPAPPKSGTPAGFGL